MAAGVYVSITGLTVNSVWTWPRFWWLTLAALRQARRAPGNIQTSACMSQGVHHTMTVWADEAAMRRFLVSGAHLQAMKAYRGLGSGRTLGLTLARAPEWPEALALWRTRSREV
jgi:hypothetical protein